MWTRNTCSNLNDGDNCGCLVVPKATIGPVWNNMWSDGTRRYHFLGLLKQQLLHTYTHGGKSLMKPTYTAMVSPGPCMSLLL